jgi:hypothetical protein
MQPVLRMIGGLKKRKTKSGNFWKKDCESGEHVSCPRNSAACTAPVALSAPDVVAMMAEEPRSELRNISTYFLFGMQESIRSVCIS